jgi:PleD family two-component response regulator
VSHSPGSPRRNFSGVRPRGPLVLIVEDEDSIRELYAAELAAAGFMVLEAADGATALEKAMQFGPHAVVLDLMLPGIDGFKVARKLREDDRTGCDSFLSKPVIAAALIGELVRLLARRSQTASAPDLSRVKGG